MIAIIDIIFISGLTALGMSMMAPFMKEDPLKPSSPRKFLLFLAGMLLAGIGMLLGLKLYASGFHHAAIACGLLLTAYWFKYLKPKDFFSNRVNRRRCMIGGAGGEHDTIILSDRDKQIIDELEKSLKPAD